MLCGLLAMVPLSGPPYVPPRAPAPNPGVWNTTNDMTTI